jgi:hypothetical protein
VRAAVISRTQAVLEAAAKGDAPSLSIGGGEQGLDEGSIENALRLCDLACQLSGLRFREARDGMHDERDGLLNRVAEDVVRGGIFGMLEGTVDIHGDIVAPIGERWEAEG